MRYYSDKLDRLFNSPEELQEAEKKAAAKEEAEKAKAKEKGKRYKEVQDAYDNYYKLLKKYIEDYGDTFDAFNYLLSMFNGIKK